MKKKWIIIILASLIGVFVLVWQVGVKGASAIFGNKHSTQSIAKQIKTTPDADWILDPEIPSNYVPVPGETNVFMVLDENGNIIEYRQRTQAEDGTWNWSTIDNPTDEKIAKVGDTAYGQLFKFTDKDGDEKYKRFVVDNNRGFAWVDTDKNGLDLNLPKGADIPDNFVPVNDNTYAVYNDNGVLQSYLQRALEENDYLWKLVNKPDTVAASNYATNSGYDGDVINNFVFGDSTYDSESWSPGGDIKTSVNRYTTQQEVDGEIVTLEVTITKTEDKNGQLLSTKKDTKEIGRTKKVDTGTGTVSNTLEAESYRLSSSVSYNTELATQLLDLLNADRLKAGNRSLSMDSGSLYKIAQIKAADMALTATTTKSSATYGTINQLASKYGISLNNPSESVLETLPTTANEIHTKFMADATTKNTRLKAASIAITVVEKNGKFYVYEAYSN